MGRSSLPLGAWGTVSAKKDTASGKWRASCRFRGYDGVTRLYSKFGATKDKAKNALLVSMMQRQAEKGRVAENPSLKDVAVKWLSSLEVPHVVVDESGNMISVGHRTSPTAPPETDNTSGPSNLDFCPNPAWGLTLIRGYPKQPGGSGAPEPVWSLRPGTGQAG